MSGIIRRFRSQSNAERTTYTHSHSAQIAGQIATIQQQEAMASLAITRPMTAVKRSNPTRGSKQQDVLMKRQRQFDDEDYNAAIKVAEFEAARLIEFARMRKEQEVLEKRRLEHLRSQSRKGKGGFQAVGDLARSIKDALKIGKK